MMNVKIESGISIPDSNFAKGYGKYPWRNMQQGDSFFISEKQLPNPKYRPSTPLFKTTSRVVIENGEKGVRVWKA
tara:strand:- start:89 stop:313 length:225 start_codon:yes stop_codon:yes gene_type:complete